MNQKNASMLVLEHDNTKITTIDLTFKAEFRNYRVTKSVGDFIELLMSRQWDFILMEHDLIKGTYQNSTDPESGWSALKWMFENYPHLNDIKQVIIHTNNVNGAKNMLELAYVAGFDNIIHLVFGSSEFKAEVLKIKSYINSLPEQK